MSTTFQNNKPVFNVYAAKLVPIESIAFLEIKNYRGKYVLIVQQSEDDDYHILRTSPIVKADFNTNTFETLNSIYIVEKMDLEVPLYYQGIGY